MSLNLPPTAFHKKFPYPTNPEAMPSVAEELAALRLKGVASQQKKELADAKGLSTPAAEEAAITDAAERKRVGNYGTEASESLKGFNAAKVEPFSPPPAKVEGKAVPVPKEKVEEKVEEKVVEKPEADPFPDDPFPDDPFPDDEGMAAGPSANSEGLLKVGLGEF